MSAPKAAGSRFSCHPNLLTPAASSRVCPTVPAPCGPPCSQVRSVEDALEELTAGEAISGYKPHDHSQPTSATKTVRFQRLPSLLVLFLMRFDPANLRQKIT